MKLKKLIPEEYISSPIDGMRKKQAINYITKTYKIYDKLKGFFNDEYWKPINEIIGTLQKNGIPISIEHTEYYKNNDGFPEGKIWQCEIPFTNQNHRDDKLYVRITAAGAGTVEDPLSRYDVTFVIN